MDTITQSILPLIHSFIHTALIKMAPFLNQPLLQVITVIILAATIDTLAKFPKFRSPLDFISPPLWLSNSLKTVW